MRRRKSSCPNIEPRRTSSTPNRNSMKLDLYIEDDELHTTPVRRNSPSPTSVHQHHHDHHQNSSRRRSSSSTTANNTIEDTAEEVLCLRLLSTRTRYRFGGLRINLISPVFNVNKLFNVEFDQDSQIALIKSQQSNIDDYHDHNDDHDDDQSYESPSDLPLFRMPNNIFSQRSSSPQYKDSSSNSNNNKGGRCATIVIEPESEDQKDEISRQLPFLTANLTLLEDSIDANAYNKNQQNQINKSHHRNHQTARSLTRITEPESSTEESAMNCRYVGKRHQSTSSINNQNSENIKFERVKVYTNLETQETTMIPNSNLLCATQQQQQPQQQCLSPSNTNNKNKKNKKKDKNSFKLKDMRRHTHFYCHMPTSFNLSSSSTSATTAAASATTSTTQPPSKHAN